MDGWMGGRMDERVGGWMDRWVDGWMDGWIIYRWMNELIDEYQQCFPFFFFL